MKLEFSAAFVRVPPQTCSRRRWMSDHHLIGIGRVIDDVNRLDEPGGLKAKKQGVVLSEIDHRHPMGLSFDVFAYSSASGGAPTEIPEEPK